MLPTKFHGNYEDQLDSILQMMVGHVGHPLTCRAKGFSWLQVFCFACRVVIAEGSTELIEQILLEHQLRDSTPRPSQ